jgi:hypothetical protein
MLSEGQRRLITRSGGVTLAPKSKVVCADVSYKVIKRHFLLALQAILSFS